MVVGLNAIRLSLPPHPLECISQGDPLQVWVAERVRELVQLASSPLVRDEADLRCIRSPIFKLSSKIPFMFEMPSLVELLRIGFMASLDLPFTSGQPEGMCR